MSVAARRPRVLFVDHVSKILGGAEVNLIELLQHPRMREDWDVRCACAPGSPLDAALGRLGVVRHGHAFEDALNELRVVGRRFSLLAHLRGWMELRNATRRLGLVLREASPDVVISCTNKDHFTAGSAAKAAGIPSLWWVNDVLSGDFFGRVVRRVFFSKAARLATRLLPVSEFAARALSAGGVSADRIVPVLNGIPLSRYRRDDRRPLRGTLALAGEVPLFGIVGRITPWKGQKLFVEVAEAWAKSGRPGCFAMIGRAFNEDGPYERELRSVIRDAGLENRVLFVPHQPEIAAAMSSLDALVHCSMKPEPFGRVLIEAMALGVPVVAANAGGVPEIISSGVDGFLCRPGCVADYVRHLESVVDRPALRESVIQAARSKVEARFTLDRVAEDFKRAVADVLPPAGPGAGAA